jgi:hypothetical protein
VADGIGQQKDLAVSCGNHCATKTVIGRAMRVQGCWDAGLAHCSLLACVHAGGVYHVVAAAVSTAGFGGDLSSNISL